MSTVTRTMAAAAQQTVHHVQQHQAGNGSGSSSGGGGGGSIGVGIGQIEAHNPALTVVSIVFLCLSVVVIALRMYVRLWMKRTVGMDDGLMVLSLLFIAGCTASVFEGQAHGWGLHEWTLNEEQRAGSSESSWFSQMQYILAMAVIQLSILMSYRRIALSRWFRWAVWMMVTVTTVWGLSFAFSAWFACVPLHRYWDSSHRKGCINDELDIAIGSISHIALSALILVLPIPIFWRLGLPFRERLILIALMSAGVLDIVASIMRTVIFYKLAYNVKDGTFYGFDVWVWTIVEINLAAICASIPTLRPFARKYLPFLGIKSSPTHRPYPMVSARRPVRRWAGHNSIWTTEPCSWAWSWSNSPSQTQSRSQTRSQSQSQSQSRSQTRSQMRRSQHRRGSEASRSAPRSPSAALAETGWSCFPSALSHTMRSRSSSISAASQDRPSRHGGALISAPFDFVHLSSAGKQEIVGVGIHGPLAEDEDEDKDEDECECECECDGSFDGHVCEQAGYSYPWPGMVPIRRPEPAVSRENISRERVERYLADNYV